MSNTHVNTKHQRYATFVRWVRKSHGWVGLWGAVLGLLFGFSGIWLNHRAVLKLPVSQERSNAQLLLPDPAPATAEAMRDWLQDALDLSGPANSMRVEPAKPVQWTEKAKKTASSESKPSGAIVISSVNAISLVASLTSLVASSVTTSPPEPFRLMQPEHWIFNFGGPNAIIQADYWRGNRSVGVTTTSNGILATLSNMHKGVGMSIPWVLLIDTLAGSMIFLSLSGVLLWVQTNRRRAVGMAILTLSMVLTFGFALARL